MNSYSSRLVTGCTEYQFCLLFSRNKNKESSNASMFLNKSVLKRKKGRRPDEEKVISSYVWQKWRRGISKRSCQMLTDEEEEGGGFGMRMATVRTPVRRLMSCFQ